MRIYPHRMINRQITITPLPFGSVFTRSEANREEVAVKRKRHGGCSLGMAFAPAYSPERE